MNYERSNTGDRRKDRERNARQAMQTGQGRVVTNVRKNYGNSRGNSPVGTNLDEDTGTYSVERVNRKVSKRIAKGRQEKGLTQKELGIRINEKASVIQQYEQGTAIPSNQVLRNLERILDVKLRGLDKEKKQGESSRGGRGGRARRGGSTTTNTTGGRRRY